MTNKDLQALTVAEIRKIAKKKNLVLPTKAKKTDYINAILKSEMNKKKKLVMNRSKATKKPRTREKTAATMQDPEINANPRSCINCSGSGKFKEGPFKGETCPACGGSGENPIGRDRGAHDALFNDEQINRRVAESTEMQQQEGEHKLQRMVMNFIETISPDKDNIIREIIDIRKAHTSLSKDDLAEKYADKICWLYCSAGAATALPGSIPGIGTGAQVAIESAAIFSDLSYMLRCMARMVLGVGHIYGRDLNAQFNQDFVRVLGVWCGVLTPMKETTVRIASKVAIAQFKKVPAEIFKKINRKVGTTIFTKYGTKRGGIALGRLVPFGVGAVVGGGFNLATMKGFKKSAINFYKTDDANLLVF